VGRAARRHPGRRGAVAAREHVRVVGPRRALDYSGFHRPVLDAALARAATAPTAEARRAAWGDVQAVLADSAPVAWLYHARGVQGVARRLRGVTMDLRGELATVHDWWIDDAPDAAP
jgi:ABC-type transport system substrate-binding protein